MKIKKVYVTNGGKECINFKEAKLQEKAEAILKELKSKDHIWATATGSIFSRVLVEERLALYLATNYKAIK